MLAREILKKVKQIEIRTRGLVDSFFGGEYHSSFKGRGMTFSEVREYQPGDDVRLIDWNVTARSGNPFIKVFEEERELTVMMVVDISSSGKFGTEKYQKREIGAEIASVLGFSAIKNNDKVGLVLFSDDIVKYIPPKKGKSHILRVIRELLYAKSDGKGTSISKALDFVMKVSKRKSVVFLLSDFLDEDYWDSLKITNRKHDFIGIKISDPYEIDLPNIGMFKVEDSESGDTFWVDTSNHIELKQMNDMNRKKNEDLFSKSKKLGIDIIPISTSENYIDPLMKFFKKRGEK